MPAHASPFKPSAPDPGPEQRLHMCGVLIGGEPGLSVCSAEIARGGISYTVDTLSAIHASHPDAELTFVVGADTARTLPAWREPGRVLELANLAVAERAGTDRAEVLDSLRPLGAAEHVSFMSMPIVDVSSSEVRLRASRGEAIEQLVGRGLARYIEAQRFYRQLDGAAG
jgi:nicotinate-nucleotide adenylyltransferase